MSKCQYFDGDLVWAKMRGYPFWPAKIVVPPVGAKLLGNRQYVFFYDTQNYSWISEKNIIPYKEFADTYSKRGRSTSFKNAVKAISLSYDREQQRDDETVKHDCCAVLSQSSPVKIKDKNYNCPGPSQSSPQKIRRIKSSAKSIKNYNCAGPSQSSPGKSMKAIKNGSCARHSRSSSGKMKKAVKAHKLPARLKNARNPAERTAQIKRFLRVKLQRLKKVGESQMKSLIQIKSVKNISKGLHADKNANVRPAAQKNGIPKKQMNGNEASCSYQSQASSQSESEYECECFMTESELIDIEKDPDLPKAYSLLEHSKKVKRLRLETEALERKKRQLSQMVNGELQHFCGKINATINKSPEKKNELQDVSPVKENELQVNTPEIENELQFDTPENENKLQVDSSEKENELQVDSPYKEGELQVESPVKGTELQVASPEKDSELQPYSPKKESEAPLHGNSDHGTEGSSQYDKSMPNNHSQP